MTKPGLRNLEAPVGSLSEYVDRIGEINDRHFRLRTATTHAWFRGQGSLDWPLTPRLYRPGCSPELERELNRDFRLFGSRYLDHLPGDEIEWLFVMQHHDVPTRLLDWTESHLVALFFAVEDASNSADAGVWALNPWILNKLVLEVDSVPLASDPVFAGYRLGDPSLVERKASAKLPAAVRPSRASARILAQRGAFTIHGSRNGGLWSMRFRKRFLVVVPIRADAKSRLRRELHLAGIGRGTLFPDLAGLGAEISYRYSDDCMKHS